LRFGGEYWREAIGGAMYESEDELLPDGGLHRFEESLEEDAPGKVTE
jgi:hypothetical protein